MTSYNVVLIVIVHYVWEMLGYYCRGIRHLNGCRHILQRGHAHCPTSPVHKENIIRVMYRVSLESGESHVTVLWPEIYTYQNVR